MTNDLFGIASSQWLDWNKQQSMQYNNINTVLY